jgi:osmotically-inducible protein OsmY
MSESSALFLPKKVCAMSFSATAIAADVSKQTQKVPVCRQRNVAELAQERLRAQPYRQLWMIVCECHEGLLTLRGVVSSYYLKQIAQAAVLGLDGVDEIANRVEVCYSPAEARPVDFD